MLKHKMIAPWPNFSQLSAFGMFSLNDHLISSPSHHLIQSSHRPHCITSHINRKQKLTQTLTLTLKDFRTIDTDKVTVSIKIQQLGPGGGGIYRTWKNSKMKTSTKPMMHLCQHTRLNHVHWTRKSGMNFFLHSSIARGSFWLFTLLCLEEAYAVVTGWLNRVATLEHT